MLRRAMRAPLLFAVLASLTVTLSRKCYGKPSTTFTHWGIAQTASIGLGPDVLSFPYAPNRLPEDPLEREPLKLLEKLATLKEAHLLRLDARDYPLLDKMMGRGSKRSTQSLYSECPRFGRIEDRYRWKVCCRCATVG